MDLILETVHLFCIWVIIDQNLLKLFVLDLTKQVGYKPVVKIVSFFHQTRLTLLDKMPQNFESYGVNDAANPKVGNLGTVVRFTYDDGASKYWCAVSNALVKNISAFNHFSERPEFFR